jgi:hypothetical protein
MAYGLRYTADFDALTIAPLNFTLNIYKNNYVGSTDTITLSSAPAVHEWQDDDPFKAIKGSTLTCGIINDGTVSLFDFYSDNDNEFFIELIWNATGETLFKGFILQDDCQEILVDFAHEISIVATDNLGLLKDITLGEAAEFAGPPSTKTGILIGYTFPTTFGTNDTRIAVLKPGQQFTIENGANAGTYTLLSISYNSFTTAYTLVVAETIPSSTAYSADITWNDAIPLDGYVSLLTLVKLCLKSTNVTCGLRVMSELYPVGGATGRWLDDTFVLGESFLQDNSYMSCYDVLEKIMSRFYASCFQAHGFWYIVRYGETFKINTSTPTSDRFNGYVYDEDFVYQVDYQEDITMIIGNPSTYKFESALLNSILRPYKSVQETFNYNQPEDLLKNANLNELGALINQYTSGSNTIREYELTYWFNWDGTGGPFPSRFIRVVSDTTTGNEIERYAVVTGTTADSSRSAQSTDIELGANDVITYSFDFKTDVSQPGVVNAVFSVRLKDGTTTYYLKDNGEWLTPNGFTYSVLAGDNTNEWHTVTITSRPAPFDGILNIFLGEETASASDETHYKNFELSITNSITGLTKVIGHVHTETQTNNLKNELSQDIFIDNSPKSTIAGTLFLHDYTGLLRNKCTEWTYTGAPVVFNRLGQITTAEMLYTRYIPRSKYNGTLLSINQLDRMMSNFQVFNLGNLYPSQYNWIVPGSVSIDYRNNTTEFTLYEVAFNDTVTYDVWQLFEDFLDVRLYNFRYLYRN